jgi:hypothetical protein
MLYNTGARTEPWGTPALIFFFAYKITLLPRLYLSVTKETNSLIRLVENSNSDNLYSRPECHVVSKTFSIPKKTAGVYILLLQFRVAWSTSLIHWSAVLWSAPKPNRLAFSKFPTSVCFWIVLKIIFISPRVGPRRKHHLQQFCSSVYIHCLATAASIRILRMLHAVVKGDLLSRWWW